MTNLYKYIAFIIFPLLISCSGKQVKSIARNENHEMKAMLQGIWLDDNTESPMLQIKGDSIHYINPGTNPVAFQILGDSLVTYGTETTSYHIKKQNEYLLWIQSEMGELIRLNKAEDSINSIDFPIQSKDSVSNLKKVIQKDHIVFYKNIRYRGYVYINPSQIKIIRPAFSDEGFKIDNIYYDNVIHICVYEGKNKLFGKDIYKKYFEGVIPEEFLQWAILSDMEFIGVNENGYQYQATVCIPNEISCYLVNISISTDGHILYKLNE